jgi:hypothetical protein
LIFPRVPLKGKEEEALIQLNNLMLQFERKSIKKKDNCWQLYRAVVA